MKIEVCNGSVGIALYVDDVRVAGPRDNGLMTTMLSATVEAPAVAPVAVSDAIKFLGWVSDSYLAHAKCTDVIDEQIAYEGSAEMAREHASALSSIIPATKGGVEQPFGLSAENIETLRSNGLKPEEIAGDQRTQARRVGELLHWFVRLSRGSANPKWTRSHAFELAYYLATTDDRAPFDIGAVERAAWLRGLNEPPEVRDMAVRHGWIPAASQGLDTEAKP